MSDNAAYSTFETLRDGRSVEIRALHQDDREAVLAMADRMSEQSRHFRFFGPKSSFSEAEIDYFTDANLVGHVVLVAVLEEENQPLIVGGSRFIVMDGGRAELALIVDDVHQGLGIATLMIRHLLAIAAESGIHELVAEVMPKNAAMLKVFRKLGSAATIKRGLDGMHVSIRC